MRNKSFTVLAPATGSADLNSRNECLPDFRPRSPNRSIFFMARIFLARLNNEKKSYNSDSFYLFLILIDFMKKSISHFSLTGSSGEALLAPLPEFRPRPPARPCVFHGKNILARLND